MKIYRYILGLAALMLTACAAEDISLPVQPDFIDNGDTFTVNVSLDVPDMQQTMTRAMGETPDYANLHLYLLEFDRNGSDPLANFFVRSYEADSETVSSNPTPTHVNFTVELNKDIKGKVLHLVAVPKGVTVAINQAQSEGYLLSRLTTRDGNEAYWQRVDLPNGYGRMTGSGDDAVFTPHADLKTKLTMVPMLRNFCSVNVVNDAGSSFVLEGFLLTNTATRGTVAPWNAPKGVFENFDDYLNNETSRYDYSALSTNYKGILPANTDKVETIPTDNDSRFHTPGNPIYTYELPHDDVHPSQVIIKGRYNGGASTYYKIDLGGNDDNGVFQPYNLLRNIAYTVNIKSVNSNGYASAAGAMNGSVFNNLSFDISTRRMLNISNGTNMLQVSHTSIIVTQNSNRNVTFRYKLRENINTANPTNGVLAADEIINLAAGDAIESVTGWTAEADGWYSCVITTKPIPSGSPLTQTFTLIDRNTGLGRQVDVTVSRPFEITRNVVYAGNYNYNFDFPYGKSTSLSGKVHNDVGAPLTVFFTIPENLPQSIFPLEFEFESNNQNIENNSVGNLVVKSGTSSFEDVNGVRIKYVKTISWKDYNTRLGEQKDGTPTGTMTPKRNSDGKMVDKDGNVLEADSNKYIYLSDIDKEKVVWQHHIRARFTTITATDGAETIIRISNPYFCLGTPDVNNIPPTTGTRGGAVEVRFNRENLSENEDYKEVMGES